MKAMRVVAVVLAVVTVLVVGTWWAARTYASRRADELFFVPGTMGDDTPAAHGLPFTTIEIPIEDRVLQAWLVRAPTPDTMAVGTAVLIFHGNRSTVTDQIGIMQVLHDHGISSMAFDYSGYGNSTGRPGVSQLRRDAEAAFAAFAGEVGFTTRKFVLATSLGAAVMLDALEAYHDVLDGVILIGTFASGRELAVRRGRVPTWLAPLLPDPYDNVDAARRLRKPVLMIHSEDDELFPVADAERVYAAIEGPKEFVRPDSTTHNEYLTRNDHWRPVLRFLAR